MGTNYYARKIPTKKRKLELCSLINTEDFHKIREEVENTFGRFELDYDRNPVGGEIHLGKMSGGWKFLWNPNIYTIRNGHMEYTNEEHTSGKFVPDPDTYFDLYPLTKEGIWNFINQPDIVIYDEYGKKQDTKEFFNTAINWTTWQGREAWDSKTYMEYARKKNPYYPIYRCNGPFIAELVKRGYKMISEDNSDFYSDGLRFSTSIEFS